MANANLDLSTQRVPGNADLPFGASSATKNTVATADIAIAEITIDALGIGVALALSDVPIDDITTDSSTTYLVNVFRGITGNPTMPFSQAAHVWELMRSAWAPYIKLRDDAAMPWQPATQLHDAVVSNWLHLDKLSAAAQDAWEQATAMQSSAASAWRYPTKQKIECGTPWEQATPISDETESTWRYPERARTSRGLPFEQALDANNEVATPWGANPLLQREYVVIPWQDADVLISLWPRPDHYTPEPPPPRIITPDLNLICKVDGTTALRFGWVCGGDNEQIIIPIQRAYIVIHDIEVLRLPDNIAISASKLAISYDVDAWAWGFSGTLLGKEALDAVLPSALGEPVTLSVNINGHIWHLVVEEWSENRSFGKRGVSVKGRGLSSFLAAPYILPASGLTTADRTLQQLMVDHLPIDSGASITWTTGMADWLVPAGAWTWSNQAPINAIHTAAQEVGMVVVPGMANKVLHIQPRYPVMPWDFASATPGFIVPESGILNSNLRQTVPSQANAVYVHGSDVGGVLARVKRIGSAGDRTAATASSTLITATDGARNLGSRILAGQHQQPAVRDITLPLGGVFGLGAVGQLASVTLYNTEHRGIINSVAIDATLTDKSVTVHQTLTLGEDTKNNWSRFKRLLPSDPLLVGTIEQTYPDGSATITLLGGGSMRVRGTGSAGQKVYVRGGMIEGQAPSMTQVEIEV